MDSDPPEQEENDMPNATAPPPVDARPDRLDTAGVAAYLGVAVETVRRYNALSYKAKRAGTYRQDRDLPPPDGFLGQSPWWYPATIDEFKRNRPGRGAPGTPKPRRGRAVPAVFEAARSEATATREARWAVWREGSIFVAWAADQTEAERLARRLNVAHNKALRGRA